MKMSESVFVDLIVIVLFCCTLFHFDVSVNLSPERYFGYLQVFIAFFFFRILFMLYPASKGKVAVLLVCLCIFQAFWGLAQLYGLLASRHRVFLTTGSFYNSGPYGGFLAMLMPLSLHLWLENRGSNERIACLGIAAVVLVLLVLPATMSRAAWVACLGGCSFVVTWKFKLVSIFRKYYISNKILFFTSMLIAIAVLISACLFLFKIKESSARGRFFMAKIIGKGIVENNFKGGGIGSFPALYAEAQMQYFDKNKGTLQERKIAGSPEYAFNEYLQLAVEQGVLALVFFLFFLGGCIWKGFKDRQIGFVGTLLALLTFATFSYPFEFALFLFAFVLLTASILSYQTSCEKIKKKAFYLYFFILIALAGTFVFLIIKQKTYYDARNQWKEFVSPYRSRSLGDKVISSRYKELYKLLNHDPHFVFEYAQLLHDSKKYIDAIAVCKRGLELSSDPMFYNIMGKNYVAIGEYDNAEKSYYNALKLLPDRIYPYFLLVNLYNNNDFENKKKLARYADSVLYKKPKVYSPAIKQMQEEVKRILINNTY